MKNTNKILSDYLLSRSSLETAVPFKKFHAKLRNANRNTSEELAQTLYRQIRRQHETKLRHVAEAIRTIQVDDEMPVKTKKETLVALLIKMDALERSLDQMCETLQVEIAQRLVDISVLVDELDPARVPESLEATTLRMKQLESKILD